MVGSVRSGYCMGRMWISMAGKIDGRVCVCEFLRVFSKGGHL